MQPQTDQVKDKPQDTTQAPQAQAQVAPPAETQEQINWRKFREVREQERKAKEESDRIAAQKSAEAEALKKAMEALLNKSQPQTHQQSYTSQEEMTDEQKIEALIDARFKQRLQQEEQARIQRESEEAPYRLKREYRDYDQVCSQENLDYVAFHYPEVANAFNGRPDGYEKWVDIYKAVKRFVPNPDSKKDSVKADKNFAKPQSMSVPGVAQTGDTAPQRLDDKRRADNWARMQKIIKSI